MARLMNVYPDKITQSGVVRRVFFHGRYLFDDGHCEWHYFGTDPIEKPPSDNLDAPIFEHPDVQFPADMNHLPADEVEDILQDLGFKMGGIKEGLTEL